MDSIRKLKPLKFCGRSLVDLRAFPAGARQDAGYQLGKVQEGMEPSDWKPMRAIGPGAREIRIREAGGAFRIIYVVHLPKTIYVLHCFQKKTRATSRGDIELARQRYNALLREVNR
ncbi:MAG TPA: type II toxin-antitoxin system RelE/ParE family toxin [Alcanivorax sp.]|jgi:phage-related protein|nr:type II toxin-antitoxin system RelE/ParE family toxin [Alcanivorax sp.]